MKKSLTSIFKRGLVLWFCVGLMFAITLAPIMAGALGAFFWSLPYDGFRDDWSAAERLLNRSEAVSNDFPIRGFRFIVMIPDMNSRCINPAIQIAHLKLALPKEPIQDIAWDMESAWVDRLINARRDGPMIYLKNLPRPVLGGLDSCMVHSVLAPACGGITRAILRNHAAEMVRHFNQKKAIADARLEAERCTFLKLATGVSPKSH